jgi:hypothetical protein
MRRRRRPRARTLAVALVTVAALGIATSAALAELSASGDLFVTFNGGIKPDALPRHRLAPISVWISGKVRTLSGAHPPAVRHITIKLNRDGRIDTHGLPVCHRSQIQALSSAKALSHCRSSLVGTGRFRARIAFPEQKPSPARARILAFNSTSHGHPVILAHLYGANPVPSTTLVVFDIQHSSGVYGTVLNGALPPSVNRWGYLKEISLNLHRIYKAKGRTHSYLSAPCSAPPGASEASFPFAYAAMTFSDGRMLSATLTRTCSVK